MSFCPSVSLEQTAYANERAPPGRAGEPPAAAHALSGHSAIQLHSSCEKPVVKVNHYKSTYLHLFQCSHEECN